MFALTQSEGSGQGNSAESVLDGALLVAGSQFAVVGSCWQLFALFALVGSSSNSCWQFVGSLLAVYWQFVVSCCRQLLAVPVKSCFAFVAVCCIFCLAVCW